MSHNFILRGGIVVSAEQDPSPLDLLVEDGRIAALLAPGTPAAAGVAERRIDGLHVFPGLIEAHMHFGFGEKVTEYETETAHAAIGGFTTVLAYFLNNEAYGDVYRREQGYARPRAHTDYGFHFSTASELHVQELPSYVKDYGVTSFKYFMNFKGEEGRYLGLDGTDDGYFHALLQQAAGIGGVTVVCHTENIEIVNRLRNAQLDRGLDNLLQWEAIKPPITEAEACIRAMFLAEQAGATIYIPHMSSKLGLDEVRRWRARYERVYVETCPHYLTHTSDMDLGGMGKANPPFRNATEREALWEGLFDGSIDVVASDHCPRKRATKDKSLWLASQGFPGTATILPVLLHEGHHKRGLPLRRICELVAANPARIFGIDDRKGALRPGMDADITLVDLNLERTVRHEELLSYSDYSIYDGWTFKGWAVETILRGKTVMQDGKLTGAPGDGQYLFRHNDGSVELQAA
ncbi:amidohydrolase family protein [Variovorax sp. J31P207]|uniref:dihydroorotase n=1 Tax=Variovorax sp. J31P207 TaxID=3053510 RepID=UPI00257830D1|nr:amidohydrolase family protein [Variovorax sp. J31P207]MDM0070629.1 amidohydrolase family protein [Variovorax sp. J31P207]